MLSFYAYRTPHPILSGLTACLLSVATATAAPSVSLQSPARNVVERGGDLNLSISAAGSEPLSFQWLKNGETIAGATGATLAISNASNADRGWYVADVTDNTGTTRSAPLFVGLGPGLLWGSPELGLDLLTRPLPRPVANQVTKVAMSGEHIVYLKSDGTLWGAGRNDYGQATAYGTPNPEHSLPWQLGTNVTELGADGNRTVFLKGDGTLWLLGANPHNQLPVAYPMQIGSGVTSFAVTANGVFWIGINGDVQKLASDLGPWTGVALSSPYNLTGLPSGITALAARANCWFFVKSDGTLWALGENDAGQLGDGTTTNRTTPVQVPVTNVAKVFVAARGKHTVFLKQDGTLWGMGRNHRGQLADGTLVDQSVPGLIATDVAEVRIQDEATYFIKTDGSLWGAGADIYAQVDGTTADRSSATLVADEVLDYRGGMLLKTDRTLWARGENFYGQLGDGTFVDRTAPVQVASGISAVTTAFGGLGYIDDHGQLWTAGLNSHGQLADGLEKPEFRLLDSNAVTVDMGFRSGLYTRDDGTLWSPDGGQITGVSGVVETGIGAFDSGRGYLKSDGTLWSLAANGTSTQLDTDVVTFAMGPTFAVFVKTDGSLWAETLPGETSPAWLNAGSGPVLISSEVKSVSVGWDHVLYIKSDQTLWGLGTQYGGWGPGQPITTSTPIQLATDISAASASFYRNLYVQTNGALKLRSWDWGNDPGDVFNVDTGVSMGVAGKTYSYYSKQEGSFWRAWGDPPWWGGTQQLGMDVTAVSTGTDGGAMLVQTPGTGNAPVINYVYSPSTEVVYGREATLSVDAHGDGPLDYQWFKDGVAIAEARGPSYRIPYATPGDGGTYQLQVTNAAGTAISDLALVTVITPLAITTQPDDRLTFTGDTAYFFVEPDSGAPVTYQWQSKLRDEANWSNLTDNAGIQNSTGANLQVAVSLARHGAQFRCIVTNLAGSVTTTAARLLVLDAVALSVSGSARTVGHTGQAVAFTGTASSAIGASLSYQWKKGTRPIPGATSPTLTLANFSPANAGAYVLEVADPYGGVARVTRFVMPDYGPTQVRAWGYNSSGQSAPPLTLNNAIAVAAGNTHSLALKVDGTLQLWGGGSQSLIDQVATLSGAVAVTAYGTRSMTLSSSGGWQIFSVASGSSMSGAFIAVALGGEQLLALRNDGTAYAANLNFSGYPAPPADLTNIAGIAVGGTHSLVCKLDGSVMAWGGNGQGQATVPGSLANVIAVAAGATHSLALKSDGTVVAWGSNNSGETTVPAGLTGVVAISANGDMSLARKSDGSVVVWGSNLFGETTVPGNLGTVVDAAVGGQHSLAVRLTAGDVTPAISSQPTGTQVTVGDPASLSVVATGTGPLYYQWRRNGTNVAGATSATLSFSAITGAQAGLYDVVVSNHIGSVTSSVAVLSVVGSNVPPFITAAPATRQVGVIGQPLALSVAAVTANSSLTYQWKRNNRPIAGATNATYTIPTFTNATAGAYTVEITDGLDLKSYATSFVLPQYTLTEVILWGGAFGGQQTLPAGTDQLVAVATGTYHPVALKADGTVVTWSSITSHGLNSVPAEATNVAAISAGGSNSLALRADGTVVIWGNNIPGVMQAPPGVLQTGLGVPQVIAASVGGSHALALKADGTVTAWGSNTQGQTTVPGGLNTVVQVAAGGSHSLALKLDGSVVAWGANGSGQSTVPAGLTDVIAISAGGSTSFALKSDGSIVAWGLADWSNQTTVPPEANPATAVFAGPNHVVALKPNTTLVSWGANTYGQQTIPSGVVGVVSAAVADSYTMVLRDAGADSAPLITQQPASALRAIGDNLTLTVTATGPGTLTYQWRKGGDALAGKTSASLLLSDIQLADAGNYDVVITNHVGSTTSQVAAVTVQAPPAIASSPVGLLTGTPGQALVLAVTATSPNTPLSYQWRKNNRPIVGAISATYIGPAFANSDAGTYTLEITDSLGLKSWYICFVRPNYTRTQLIGWGRNDSGEASPPNGPAFVSAVSLGGRSVGVTRDGNVIGFGGSQPTALPHGMTDVASITNGIVLKSDGTLATWIPSGPGPAYLPLPSGLRNVVAVQTGDNYALALKTDGTVVAWGNNDHGQLNMPAGLSGVVQIAAGDLHALAVKLDGTVAIWGRNVFNVGYTGPVTNTLADVVAASAGDTHTTLLKANGQVLYAYGGAIADYDNPSMGATTGTAIASGEGHSLALTPSGGVVAWGDNWYGQSTVPAVAGDGVTAIFAGYNQSFALRDASNDTAPVITSQPASLIRSEGQSASFTVGVSGEGPFGYQWRKGGVNLSGATSATLSIPDISPENIGNYDVVVSNHVSSVASNPATLSIAGINQAPTASFTLSSERVVGQTLTINLEVGDPDGNYGFANLWVNTPGRGWLTIKSDNSIVQSGTLNSSNSVAATAGTHTRTFTFTPTDGSGTYTFALTVSDTLGLETSAAQQTVTISSDIRSDFNGDGHPDLVWQHAVTGQRYLWFMNGATTIGDASLGTVHRDWHIAATADFNGDDHPDILWEHLVTGQRYVWFMNGATTIGDASLGTIHRDWHIAAAADFNSDGHPDILWEHAVTGQRYLWFMNGSTTIGDASLDTIHRDWHIAAAADFNGDGHPDILWEHAVTGLRYLWFMHGSITIGDVSLGTVHRDWHIAAAADFNGDGHPDILWEHAVTGVRYLWFMNGAMTIGDASLGTVAADWHIVN